jgi:queuine tRNA-ribosyltransferase
MYCLDDCTNAEDDDAEQALAVERTIRWAAKGRATFDAQVRPASKRASHHGTATDDAITRDGTRPHLFGVVQGGGSASLRRDCAQALVAIGFDGFGYGGWPLTPDGSLRADMLRVVAEALPAGTPLHALGVGRPDHVVRAHALGYTIFDCTLPTRDARRGRLYAWRDGFPAQRPRPGDDFYEAQYLLDQVHANDFRPVDATCDCPACTYHSRAYLRHLFKIGETAAWRLATLHNLRFYTRLMESLRTREG